MTTSPASIAEQIAFHEQRLTLHERNLPLHSSITHQTRLAELRAVDPWAVDVAEIERQLAGPLTGPERAVREEDLRITKQAQAAHHIVRLKGRPITDPELVKWTKIHRSATTGPDVTDDDAHAFVREYGTIGLSESEPSAEDRIVADIAGAPLPPAASEVEAAAIRDAQARSFRAAERDRLTALAEAANGTRADVEQEIAVARSTRSGWVRRRSGPRRR